MGTVGTQSQLVKRTQSSMSQSTGGARPHAGEVYGRLKEEEQQQGPPSSHTVPLTIGDSAVVSDCAWSPSQATVTSLLPLTNWLHLVSNSLINVSRNRLTSNLRRSQGKHVWGLPMFVIEGWSQLNLRTRIRIVDDAFQDMRRRGFLLTGYLTPKALTIQGGALRFLHQF